MNEATFLELKNAFQHNELNVNKLMKIKFQIEPLYADYLDYIMHNSKEIGFDHKRFSNVKNVNKDELVITFLLFICKHFNFIKMSHTFAKPYSNMIYDWMFLYKYVIYSVLALVYNKQLTTLDYLSIDETMLLLNKGHPDAIRMLMKKLNLLSQDIMYEAEMDFKNNLKYDAQIYGPFVWRFLHLMAEAMDLRKNFNVEKQIWKEFTLYHLKRLLRCSICYHHYETLTMKYNEQLKSFSNLPDTWYNLHNDVNESLGKPKYSMVEFNLDREVMQKMLN